jgi:hypothetical protein
MFDQMNKSCSEREQQEMYPCSSMVPALLFDGYDSSAKFKVGEVNNQQLT